MNASTTEYTNLSDGIRLNESLFREAWERSRDVSSYLRQTVEEATNARSAQEEEFTMPEKVWRTENGEEGLKELCHLVKLSAKRTYYNQIRKVEETIEGLQPLRSMAPQDLRVWLDAVDGSSRMLKDIKKQAKGLTLGDDMDMVRSATRIFKKIIVNPDFVEGGLGEFHMTFRGTTFYIGKLRIRYIPRGGNIGADNTMRVRVHNDDMPRPTGRGELPFPHPHVMNSPNTVCWGTWKVMMKELVKSKVNWLRILVMTSEFLKVYCPTGPPYIKLALGWKNRVTEGPEPCTACEKIPNVDCTCVRVGVDCPKTGDRIERIPFHSYCRGCAHYLVEAEQNLCTWPATTQAFVDANRPVIEEGENRSDPTQGTASERQSNQDSERLRGTFTDLTEPTTHAEELQRAAQRGVEFETAEDGSSGRSEPRDYGIRIVHSDLVDFFHRRQWWINLTGINALQRRLNAQGLIQLDPVAVATELSRMGYQGRQDNNGELVWTNEPV